MIGFVRDLRLVPIALVASACLLALKTADLLLDGGYLISAEYAPRGGGDASIIRSTPDMPQAAEARRSWAQRMFNFPDPSRVAGTPVITSPKADRIDADITGAIGGGGAKGGEKGLAPASGEGAAPAAKEGADGKPAAGAGKEAKPAATEAKPASGTLIPGDGPSLPSGAERAILERLQERRQQLDVRARELDIREGLLQAAEKRVEARLAELKGAETQAAAATEKKSESDAARLKSVVTMYENMKPRDAAKIFDRLDIAVLFEVASQINPRRMSDILAQMSPDVAQRLTVELANRARAPEKGVPDLPKIEGRPTTP